MHALTANAPHALITARLLIGAKDSKDTGGIADGLNELLRDAVSDGFLADYALENVDNPPMFTTDADPEEGEFVDAMQSYLVVVEDSMAGSEEYRVDTQTELDSLSQDELKKVLSKIITFGPRDVVLLTNLSKVQKLVL